MPCRPTRTTPRSARRAAPPSSKPAPPQRSDHPGHRARRRVDPAPVHPGKRAAAGEGEPGAAEAAGRGRPAPADVSLTSTRCRNGCAGTPRPCGVPPHHDRGIACGAYGLAQGRHRLIQAQPKQPTASCQLRSPVRPASVTRGEHLRCALHARAATDRCSYVCQAQWMSCLCRVFHVGFV